MEDEVLLPHYPHRPEPPHRPHPPHHPDPPYRPDPPRRPEPPSRPRPFVSQAGFLARTASGEKAKALIVFRNPQIDTPEAHHQGLGITALNVALSLRDLQIGADAGAVTNGEHLWAQLASTGQWAGYTHIALSAPFIDADFLGKMFNSFPTKRFALIYHSNLGFLTQDRFAGVSIPKYLALQKRCPNFWLASNCAGLSSGMTEGTGIALHYLPNLYHIPHEVRQRSGMWAPGKPLNVGLFGAARLLKNWPTAAVAAMIMQRTLHVDVRLHVSQDRDEGAGATREILDALIALNPRVTQVAAPWLNHDDFRRYLYGMDLLLQPSYSESFNNVTADGVFSGVPSVVSEAIGWVPPEWTAKADSAISVAEVGCAILHDPDAVQKGWNALVAYNTAGGEAWMQWLGEK